MSRSSNMLTDKQDAYGHLLLNYHKRSRMSGQLR